MILFSAALLCCLGAGPPQDHSHGPDFARMSREERVRLLRQHMWEVVAVPVQGALRIDGRLDEPAWDEAPPISDFHQRERNEGLPATEQTEVRVLYETGQRGGSLSGVKNRSLTVKLNYLFAF